LADAPASEYSEFIVLQAVGFSTFLKISTGSSSVMQSHSKNDPHSRQWFKRKNSIFAAYPDLFTHPEHLLNFLDQFNGSLKIDKGKAIERWRRKATGLTP